MEDCRYRRRRGPSSLSEEFTNGTSTIDIDDRHFDDHDSNDEANNHLPKVSTIFVRLLSSPVMILRKGNMVIGGVLYSFGSGSGWGVLSSFPTSSTAPVLAVVVPLVVGVGNDSSSPPLVVKVGDDSSFLPSKTSMSSPIDVQHQDKEKEVVIDEEKKVAMKRALEEEGAVVDSRRVKRSRMAPTQETSESV
ncbi:hypothetical protein Adt_18598 [Abeliophyllum distichum]|uniref:Uncharacterized protein n=1 Tax=Abeliophyllum distichum TaxID=126358 RepID=A0ABD1TJT9_9LAMI